jgi:hypothetical protein
MKVKFTLAQVVGLELAEFNRQNVIARLDLEEGEDGAVRFRLAPCYGLNGWIDAKGVEIEIVEEASG